MDRNTRPMEDGQKVDNCPLHGNVYCFWSCRFWNSSKCTHPTQAERKQLEDLYAMREEEKGKRVVQ